MAGSWEVTDGRKTWRVSQAEYADLVANRPSYLAPITVLSKGKMRANIETRDGIADVLVDPEQIAHRAKYGQDISATPESIEAARRDEQKRTKHAMAEEENLTSFANAALPAAKYFQDMAVGKDNALEARQELSTNVIANLGGNLAEFAIGGKIASMAGQALLGSARAADLGTTLGFSAKSGLAAKTGRLIAEDIAIETHLYTQQLLDNNKQFVAEEWAQQVGVGLMMAGPIIAGGAGRAAAAALVKKAGPGVASKLSSFGDVLTTSNILKPEGMKGRYAAAAHVAGRVMRKVGRKRKVGKGLSASDELLKRQDDLLDNMDHSGSFTPERVAAMAPGKRAKFLDEYKRYAEGDTSFLDEIDWDGIKEAPKMAGHINAVRKQTLSIHRRFKGDAQEVTMSAVGYGRALNKANELLAHASDVGMADVKGALQRAIIDGGDATSMTRALMEAKINARFRRGVDGGADIVDDSLSAFLVDKDVFSASQIKKNQQALEAVDGVVQTWDDLGTVKSPRHMEQIQVSDGVAVANAHGKIDNLRAHMDSLAARGYLSADQVRGIETKLIEANDSLVKGTRGYADVIKINKSREGTNGALKKLHELNIDIPTTAEGFAAQKSAMVAETAGEIVELGLAARKAISKGVNWASDPRRVVPVMRGVAGLSQLSLEEKHATFNAIQKELPTMTGNPLYTIEKMAPMLDRGAAFDPVGADLAGQKAMNTMYWLASQMPKMDQTIYGKDLPTPTSLVEEYMEKHLSAADPLSVAYATLAGRVTPGMVDAVRVTSPAMYAELMATFAEVLAEADAETADPKVVSAINLFMGGVDPMYSGDFIMQLQSTYAQTTTQDGMMRSGGANNMPNPKDPGQSPYTTSQGQQQ